RRRFLVSAMLYQFLIAPPQSRIYTRVTTSMALRAGAAIGVCPAQFFGCSIFRVSVCETMLIRTKENLRSTGDRFKQPVPRNLLPAVSAESLKVFAHHFPERSARS